MAETPSSCLCMLQYRPKAYLGSSLTLFRFKIGFDKLRRRLRDNGIGEGADLIHSSGKPMNHAAHVGFKFPPILSRKVPDRWPLLVNAGQRLCLAMCCRLGLTLPFIL